MRQQQQSVGVGNAIVVVVVVIVIKCLQFDSGRKWQWCHFQPIPVTPPPPLSFLSLNPNFWNRILKICTLISAQNCKHAHTTALCLDMQKHVRKHQVKNINRACVIMWIKRRQKWRLVGTRRFTLKGNYGCVMVKLGYICK